MNEGEQRCSGSELEQFDFRAKPFRVMVDIDRCETAGFQILGDYAVREEPFVEYEESDLQWLIPLGMAVSLNTVRKKLWEEVIRKVERDMLVSYSAFRNSGIISPSRNTPYGWS